MIDSIFFRLSPRLQQGIAQVLGWGSLRLVQEMTIDAVQSGANCIVLAPTAGGKTEAAFFPILDHIYRRQLPPVSALYISPIRALLNNQEPRLTQLAGLVGLDVFKWHGDVLQSARRRFLDKPAHVLMSTPESLEVMLISSKVNTQEIFAGLRFVVIDEIHHFAADDRGAHLTAVLERLGQFSSVDIQRIGLSATVGNPEQIGEWVQGASHREIRIIRPPAEASTRLIRIDTYEDEEELAQKVAPLVNNRKTLFFVEGRKLAEGVKQAIQKVAAIAYVHHSSVGRELREEAEQSFMYGRGSQCIVCTSTMELGIDVGDLDAVLQQDAPITVSSFMQRMGRTGRRSGTRTEMDFFCRDNDALLRAVALVNLAKQKWIESVKPTRFAIHILAHQILAQALQYSGVRRELLWQSTIKAYCFSQITREDFDHLVNHLVKTDILNLVSGLLVFGKTGEKRFGRDNFLELYSVFETPQEVQVVTPDRRVIGTLQAWFVQLSAASGEMVFVLAGQAWQGKHLDLDSGELIVVPAPQGAIPKWNSGGAMIGKEISEEIRRILASDESYSFLTSSALRHLNAIRQEWQNIVSQPGISIIQAGREWQVYTFAGDRINLLLGHALSQVLSCDVSGDSLELRIKPLSSTPLQKEDLIRAIEIIQQPGYFTEERLIMLAKNIPRGRWSKFQSLLPPGLEARFLADKLFDLDEMMSWMRNAFESKQ